jgi:nucleoside-diphosphate-sugar epimerase
LFSFRGFFTIFEDNASRESRFFYISTAYSCGITNEPFREKFYENKDISHFRNFYEQSKRQAENIVRQHIETRKIKANIIRLSQVVGNSHSGVTKTHYGIFDFITKLQKFSAYYPNETVRIPIDPIATQNLILIPEFHLRSIISSQLFF